jgi:hypothetical protein
MGIAVPTWRGVCRRSILPHALQLPALSRYFGRGSSARFISTDVRSAAATPAIDSIQPVASPSSSAIDAFTKISVRKRSSIGRVLDVVLSSKFPPLFALSMLFATRYLETGRSHEALLRLRPSVIERHNDTPAVVSLPRIASLRSRALRLVRHKGPSSRNAKRRLHAIARPHWQVCCVEDKSRCNCRH